MTISLSHKLDQQVDRALDYLEGRQQSQINAITQTLVKAHKQLYESYVGLKKEVDAQK